MVASQHLHGGDIDQQPTARPGHAVHFANRRLLDRVRQGIQYVEGSDDIEGGIGKGNRCDRRACRAYASGGASQFQTARGEIEAEGSPELPEKFQIIAGAAPAVEQLEVGPATSRALEEWPDEEPKATKPEMALFSGGCRSQQVVHWYEL